MAILLHNCVVEFLEKEPMNIEGVRSILVVEDSPVVFTIIRKYAERNKNWKIQVSWAADGMEGLKAAKAQAPDLILLDLMMPNIDGFQFLEIALKTNVCWNIPILVHSAVDPKELDAVKNHPLVKGIVDKSMSPSKLFEVILKFLAEPSPRENQIHHLEGGNFEKAITSAEKLRSILVVEDSPIVYTIVKKYAERHKDWRIQVNWAINGMEGLKAVKERAPDLILLDLMMPEYDGFLFLEVALKTEVCGNVPILVYSAADAETRHKAKKHPLVKEVVDKSTSPSKLFDIFLKYLPV